MASFINTLNPTPFGFFDDDASFQFEADALVTFVKRKLGDDILSVELTKKQIWTCFEESFLEYGKIVNEFQAESHLMNLLGFPTGSNMSGSYDVGPHGKEQLFPLENLEFLLRRAEPYAMEAGIGGSYNTMSGSIQLVQDQQDYDIYSELKDENGDALFDSAQNDPQTKIKILDVYHFSPQAAYRFFDTTSAINYLNNEFSFESFTPETVFYVLPVFEDILRAGQMDISNRVRRSNYSYRISGTKIRVFPRPTQSNPKKLWMRIAFSPNPFNPSYPDAQIYGVSNLSNIPYGNLRFQNVNSMGRQWVRQYTLAACKEMLGLIRSKFSSVPIPGGDLSLNGSDLISQGREEQSNLKTSLNEMLTKLTYSKMIEDEASAVESMQKILRHIPVPGGKAIIVG
ncbi:MAG: hypothetical protein CME70_06175 [Halobacteriovorax sp.]|nr:hypothetical protein [Halobacteriovorax sp.]|tara:strand:+ start:265 stop:1461 length:1197 start_codon:yes stop_codon:yes gene_type:complete